MEMVSKALHERFNYGGILKEVISERISYDYIVGKRKRVENCPINLLHFPKQKTDNEMRVYMKQTITDIQVKTRAPKKRNIHSLILGSFAREASVVHSKYSRKKPSNNNKVADIFFWWSVEGHCGSFITGARTARERASRAQSSRGDLFRRQNHSFQRVRCFPPFIYGSCYR